MNWGYRIFISFLVFGALMISLVVISFNQEVNLVSEDYYEQEIKYQEQIDRIRNFKALPEKPEVILVSVEDRCILKFPQILLEKGVEGTVHFFRPSDSRLDQLYSLKLEKGNAVGFDTAEMKKGLWEVQVKWSDGEKEYYFKKNIFL